MFVLATDYVPLAVVLERAVLLATERASIATNVALRENIVKIVALQAHALLAKARAIIVRVARGLESVIIAQAQEDVKNVTVQESKDATSVTVLEETIGQEQPVPGVVVLAICDVIIAMVLEIVMCAMVMGNVPLVMENLNAKSVEVMASVPPAMAILFARHVEVTQYAKHAMVMVIAQHVRTVTENVLTATA